MAETKTVFAVLLYPPIGRPRVVEFIDVPIIHYPIELYSTRTKADAALERFLTENPEYRRWLDGRINPEPVRLTAAPHER